MGKTKKTKTEKKVRFNSRVTVDKIEKHNASDFENKVKGMNGTILFHHPGCVHCIMLRPKWNQMIQQLKNKNVQCRVLEVNAEALSLIHHPLAQVDGFPRIINVENGVERDVFGDERNVANMLNFVINNLKGKKLAYDYNLNEKNNLVKITDQNNLKKLRGQNKNNNKKNKTNKTKKNQNKRKRVT
jgi:thiol-disulfide isomerase/thioredoxin